MATYYVSFSAGSDNNTGISAATPWKSLAKINAATLQPGDTVLLARGDEWHGQLAINESGQADRPITVGSYGSGELPVISGSVELAKTLWKSEGSGVWSVAVQKSPTQVFMDDQRGIHKGTLASVAQNGDWIWQNGRLYVHASTSPNTAYGSLEASVQESPVLLQNVAHLVFKDIAVEKGYTGNFTVRDSSNIKMLNLDISHSGKDGIHFVGNSNNNLVSGGRSYSNGLTADDPIYPLNRGHGYAVGQQYGAASNNVIENTEAFGNAEDGIQFGDFAGNGNVARNNYFHHNFEDGIDFKHGDQLIERNVLVDNAVKGLNIGFGHKGGYTGTTTLLDNYVSGNGLHALFNDSGGKIYSSGNVYDGLAGTSVAARLLNIGDGSKFEGDVFLGGGSTAVRMATSVGTTFKNSILASDRGAGLEVYGTADKPIVTGSLLASDDNYAVSYDNVTGVTSNGNVYWRGNSSSNWLLYNRAGYDQAEISNGAWTAKTGQDAASRVAPEDPGDLAKVMAGLPHNSVQALWNAMADAFGVTAPVVDGTPLPTPGTQPQPQPQPQPEPELPPAPTPVPGGKTINGTASAESLSGSAGDDSVNGLGGNDTLFGNDGHDRLDGGIANDRLEGGNGNDTLLGGAGDDRLNGGAGSDLLEGGDGRDVLYGKGENDTLKGGAGNDNMRGDDGNDVLSGDQGNDTLLGDAGADVLNGGAGTDVLYGGAGRDRFVVTADAGIDRFADFRAADDVIDLSQLLIALKMTADQAFNGGYIDLHAAQSGTGVFFDADGSAGAGGALQVAYVPVSESLLDLGTNVLA